MMFLSKILQQPFRIKCSYFVMDSQGLILLWGCKPAFSGLFFQSLFDCLTFRTLNNEIFIKGFFAILQAGKVILGKKVNNDLIYYGIESQPAFSCLFFIVYFQVSFISFKNALQQTSILNVHIWYID